MVYIQFAVESNFHFCFYRQSKVNLNSKSSTWSSISSYSKTSNVGLPRLTRRLHRKSAWDRWPPSVSKLLSIRYGIESVREIRGWSLMTICSLPCRIVCCIFSLLRNFEENSISTTPTHIYQTPFLVSGCLHPISPP